MLEVLPIQDKAEQEALCLRCNVPFRVELLAYKALVDGELRGICQFTMNQEGGKIVDFAHVPNLYEFEPMFVMGRAALNFIDLCGIHRAFFDAEYDNDLFRSPLTERSLRSSELYTSTRTAVSSSKCVPTRDLSTSSNPARRPLRLS